MRRKPTRKSGVRLALSKRLSHYIKVFIVLFLLGFLAWLLYYFFIESGTFSIKNIKIIGAQKYVNEADITAVSSANVLGKNILIFNEETFTGILKKNFEGAKKITVVKILPTTLSITVQERKPLALVKKPNTDDLFIIDADGYVLGGIGEPTDELPVLFYNGEIKTGTFIDKNLIPSYLELINYLSESNLKVSSLSFYPKYSEFYLNADVQILIGNDKNKKEAINLVKNLLDQTTEEKQKIKKVDLRYEKVIVSY